MGHHLFPFLQKFHTYKCQLTDASLAATTEPATLPKLPPAAPLTTLPPALLLIGWPTAEPYESEAELLVGATELKLGAAELMG